MPFSILIKTINKYIILFIILKNDIHTCFNKLFVFILKMFFFFPFQLRDDETMIEQIFPPCLYFSNIFTKNHYVLNIYTSHKRTCAGHEIVFFFLTVLFTKSVYIMVKNVG